MYQIHVPTKVVCIHTCIHMYAPRPPPPRTPTKMQTTPHGEAGPKVGTPVTTVRVRFTGAKGVPDEHVDVKDLLDVNEDTMRLKKVGCARMCCGVCVVRMCVLGSLGAALLFRIVVVFAAVPVLAASILDTHTWRSAFFLLFLAAAGL